MRCLVIDDDEHDRALVARMVQRAGHEPACVDTPEGGLEMARTERFDVALVDLSMPGTDGVAALRLLRLAHPELPLLVVSGYDDRPHVIEAVAAGADGYVLKTDLGERLQGAIDEVTTGGGPMSSRIAHFVLEELRLDGTEDRRRARRADRVLSKRNWDVLDGLSRGMTYAGIADELQITVNTVRHHVRAIYAKLDARDRKDAVSRAFAHPATRRKRARPAPPDAPPGPSLDEDA
jgi:DNA-binding NarL/FixJ family response regulator